MKDSVVVITGASAGIGASLARQVAERGARPVLVARRERELSQIAEQCGDEALVVVADVTDRAAVAQARDRALERFGAIDVWVNNAGRGITRKVAELTDDDLDDMMRVNVKSALYGMQEVLPHFIERGRGHIINVSSMLGRVPLASFRSAYCAAKHALNALTACLRGDLADEHPGIVVSSVHPGVVATEFGLNALHGGVDSRAIPGAQTADEVAAVIVDTIVTRRADVYTRAQGQRMVVDYYAADDMAVAETKPPFFRPRR